MDEVVKTLTELQEALLQKEANAEKAEVEELLKALSLQELADAGIALPRLVITDISSGLYGRTIVTFTSKKSALDRLHGNGNAKRQHEQQQHRLSPGDIVGVFPYDRPISGSSSAIASGVVHKVHTSGLNVAFDEEDGENWLQQHPSASQGSGGSLGPVYSLCLVSNEVTIKRQRNALRALREEASDSPASRVVEVCFGHATPRFMPFHLATLVARGGPNRTTEVHAESSAPAEAENLGVHNHWKDVQLPPDIVNGKCLWREWFSDKLTESQRRAVLLSLLSQDVALIHGPPGTGKTTTVVEVLMQLAAAGFRVLACAPSNIAVDNMLERCFATAKIHQNAQLLKQIKRCVRIGHPARVDEQLSGFCLDKQHLNSDSSGVIRGLKASLDESLRELNTLKRRRPPLQQEREEANSAKRELRAEVKQLKKDMKSLQKKSVMEALQAAPIVFATCAGAADVFLQSMVKGKEAKIGDSEIQGMPFDVVVIDEAAQALEASCWIPLLLGKRCVLAGDHMQLPPTVRSAEALRQGLGVSLFERLMQKLRDRAGEQLICQFRMHKNIMAWSNMVFYEDSLVAADCVEGRLLCDLYPNIPADDVPPVLWIDTAGISWMREDEDGAKEMPVSFALNKSRSNRGEAALVLMYVKELVETYGVSPADIGVITPYAAQAKLIRHFLADTEQETESEGGLLGNVTVQTVDGFQGREREVIIISLVRSNHRRELGFLADARRLNVAVTRARSHIVIIGDSETVTEGSSNSLEASSNTSSGTLSAPPPQMTQPSEVVVKQKPAPDVRKALTALFQLASTFGDIRLPYEYLTSSDVPPIDGQRLTARTDKKVSLTGGEQRTKKSQIAGGNSKSAKMNKGPSRDQYQNTHIMAATPASKDAGPPRSGTQEDDAFARDARKALEKLRRQADAVKAKLNGRIDQTCPTSLTHAFPPSLTSYQRLLVHQLAEELHLEHISKGEGTERFIEVRVNLKSTQKHLYSETSLGGKVAEDDRAAAGGQQPISTPEPDSVCLSKEVKGDLSTPRSVGEEEPAQYQVPPLPKAKQSTASKQRKKPSKKAASVTAATGDESEDIDALLEQHMMENKKCGLAGCKDSTELMGRMCPYCKSRFCLRHALPEVHGCGDAAAAEAKKSFRAQGKNNIRLMAYAKDGTLGTRAATIAGTAFANPEVGGNAQMREKLKTNLRKNIEEKTSERAPQRGTKKKS